MILGISLHKLSTLLLHFLFFLFRTHQFFPFYSCRHKFSGWLSFLLLKGSIGVIASLPNFSERMKREGVDYEEVTAGKICAWLIIKLLIINCFFSVAFYNLFASQLSSPFLLGPLLLFFLLLLFSILHFFLSTTFWLSTVFYFNYILKANTSARWHHSNRQQKMLETKCHRRFMRF